MGLYFKAFFHFAILVQCLFFVLYVARIKTSQSLTKALFIAFLAVKLIPEMGDFFYYFFELRLELARVIPYFFYYQEAFDFAWPPLLFLYVISKLRPSFRLRPIHLVHALPFVLMLAFAGNKINEVSATNMVEGICYRELWGHQEFLIFTWGQYIQFFVYALLAWRLIKNRMPQGGKMVSANYEWLKLLVGGLLIWRAVLVTDLSLWLLAAAGNNFLLTMHIIAELVFLTTMMLYVIKGIKQESVIVDVFKSKRQKSAPIDHTQALLNTLQRLMDDAKPWLNADLRIKDVADELGLGIHELSQLVNDQLGKNFQEYVNGYRIEESKRLLTNYSHREKNISEILYEVGFNSKSVFNTAFKKHTQLTPKAYRDLHSLRVQSA